MNYQKQQFTTGSTSLSNYQHGQLSKVADRELIQLIAHLIQPPGSIPGVGRVKCARKENLPHLLLHIREAVLGVPVPGVVGDLPDEAEARRDYLGQVQLGGGGPRLRG